jgi:6-phosphogluconolactonase|tara:strand:- start:1615 stop:2664 length:1050 start_codon:yes stop_codon:yes gene_type:complete
LIGLQGNGEEQMTDYLITSIGGPEPKVIVDAIDSAGDLRRLSDLACDGPPGPLAVSPNRQHLYVSVQVDGQHLARSYRIGDDGDLTLTGQTEMGGNPCHLSTDNTGRFLLGAYYSDGMATTDPIDTDGALGGQRTSHNPTELRAHYIQTDPSNRFAFVPHVDEANCVYQFRFDEATGKLTANDPPQVSPPPGQGPRHLCFHPSGRYAYTNGEQGSSVTIWDYDESTGCLSAKETLTSLPEEGFDEPNHPSQLHISPNGRFLFSGNRGHHSVAGFMVNEDGSLQPTGLTPADPNPRPITVSPDSRFLFAAGNTEEGRLARWQIDQDSGERSETTHYNCGPVSWVISMRRD